MKKDRLTFDSSEAWILTYRNAICSNRSPLPNESESVRQLSVIQKPRSLHRPVLRQLPDHIRLFSAAADLYLPGTSLHLSVFCHRPFSRTPGVRCPANPVRKTHFA